MTDTYTDPSKLFSIHLPAGFRRDEDVKALVFRGDDLDGAVTVTCLRHQTDKIEVDIFDALPSRDSMQNITRGERDGMKISYGDYEGELQNRPEYWRWWTLQLGSVAVVVSFNGAPEQPDAQRQAVDQLVSGIRIHPSPPLSAADFTTLAARVYGKALDTDAPRVHKPLELDAGENAHIHLENAYMSYLELWDADNDADPEAMLLSWFEQIWGNQTAALGEFEDCRDLLYPVVKPAGFAAELEAPLVRRVLVEGELELFCAMDTGRTLRFLNREDLEAWEGVSEDDVFFYARENLANMDEDLPMQSLADEQGNIKAVIVAQGDSHDAARVMLPNLYAKLSEVMGPDLLVGVPNRDFMIVLTADDEELVANVGGQVKIDAETRPYAISGKLYRLTDDGLTQYAGS